MNRQLRYRYDRYAGAVAGALRRPLSTPCPLFNHTLRSSRITLQSLRASVPDQDGTQSAVATLNYNDARFVGVLPTGPSLLSCTAAPLSPLSSTILTITANILTSSAFYAIIIKRNIKVLLMPAVAQAPPPARLHYPRPPTARPGWGSPSIEGRIRRTIASPNASPCIAQSSGQGRAQTPHNGAGEGVFAGWQASSPSERPGTVNLDPSDRTG